MNRHCYRVVFNQRRGQLMVVDELARTKRLGAPRVRSGLARARRSAGVGVMLAVVLLWPGWGEATIIADSQAPQTQQPNVLAAPNGVPLVNIRPPNPAGISHNSYQAFDVPRQGTILNNSSVRVQTQLGGWIAANPGLPDSGARVILNEVNSANPTLLQGFIEVAGRRAQVIVANPAGIKIDGAGFINAHQVTLTTGRPQFQGESLDSYRITSGQIQIQGQGLNNRQVNYTEVMARAVHVNADVQAQRLKITLGRNVIPATAGAGAITPLPSTDSAPEFALDVAQLGGLYAQHIFLLGTEAGVGVRNQGGLRASTGPLVLNSAGWLQQLGSISSQGDCQLQAQQQLTVAGQIESQGSQQLQGSTLELSGAQLQGQALQLNAARGPVVARGATLVAKERLQVSTPATLISDQGKLTAAQLILQAKSLSNVGGELTQQGPEPLTIHTETLDNTQGRLHNQGGSWQLRTQQLCNHRGEIIHAGSGALSIQVTQFQGSGGVLEPLGVEPVYDSV